MQAVEPQPALRTSEQQFWTHYAKVYQRVLGQFSPHRELMQEICGTQAQGRLLDVGCGPGMLSRRLARTGCRVIGVDYNPRMIAHARAQPVSGVRFLRMNAERLSFAEGSFDGVVCSNLLYYVPDPARVLGQIRRVLRAGGRLTLTGPHTEADLRVLDRRLRTELADRPDMAEAVESFLECNRQIGRHGLRNLYDLAGIRELLVGVGFSRIERSNRTYLGQNYFVVASVDGGGR